LFSFSNRKTANLPFYDVMLMENLPKSASIPVSTVQQTKLRIQNGTWDFDYIFFTESDQVGDEEVFLYYFSFITITTN
jgi:hypothetical protein